MTQFFLDTADRQAIARWQDMGLVEGVTTNPVLLAAQKQEPRRLLESICAEDTGPVSVEVTHTELNAMFKQAMEMSKIAPNIYIKVPASPNGFLLAKRLQEQSIRINVTLIFHASQAIPFIRQSCDIISVIVAKPEDCGVDNRHVVGDTKKIVYQLHSASQILAASIRQPSFLVQVINDGADIITVPPSTWEKVFDNPLFHAAEQEFLGAWEQIPEQLKIGLH